MDILLIYFFRELAFFIKNCFLRVNLNIKYLKYFQFQGQTLVMQLSFAMSLWRKFCICKNSGNYEHSVKDNIVILQYCATKISFNL